MKEKFTDVDLELKNIFAKTVIPTPDDFDDFVQEKIEQGLEENQLIVRNGKSGRRIKRNVLLVAVVLVGLLVGMLGVSAGISYYDERMSKLTEEEIENLLSYADNSTSEAMISSRKMSESEQSRMGELTERYVKEGLFPKNSVLVVDSPEEMDKNTLSFWPPETYFNYPQREMTDEELLQIIDWLKTTDYVLYKRAMENQPVVDMLPDSELEEMGVNELKKYFEISDNYYSYVYHYNITGDDGDGYWADVDVRLIDKVTNKHYTAEIEAISGMLRQVFREDNGYSYETVSLSEEHFKNILKDIKVYAEEFSGQKCIYSDINFEMLSDTEVDGGSGCCCFEMADGSWVVAAFVVENGELLSLHRNVNEEYVVDLRNIWKRECGERLNELMTIVGE